MNEETEGKLYERLTYPRLSLYAHKAWYDRVKKGEATFPRPTHDEVIKEILDETNAEFPDTFIQEILEKYQVSPIIRKEIQAEVEKIFTWRTKLFGETEK